MNNIRRKYNIDKLHKRGIAGHNITVAVLDTGIYPHKDFDSRITCFYDCINHQQYAYDDNSHGSHVCGIIAGNGGQSRGLYTGIAPMCNIISIKILDSKGVGNQNSMIKGIEWILDNAEKYNIRVVNISVGTKSHSCDDSQSELVKAVEKMWSEGLTVIASAGNNGPDYSTITIPGISSKIITVGASDSYTKRNHTNYSGKGPTHCNDPKPDITALGYHIISCHHYGTSYAAKSGTSMSTPIVSGAAALTFSYNNKLTNESFKEFLCYSARDIGLDRYTQGAGELDIHKLLSLAKPVF